MPYNNSTRVNIVIKVYKFVDNFKRLRVIIAIPVIGTIINIPNRHKMNKESPERFMSFISNLFILFLSISSSINK